MCILDYFGNMREDKGDMRQCPRGSQANISKYYWQYDKQHLLDIDIKRPFVVQSSFLCSQQVCIR